MEDHHYKPDSVSENGILKQDEFRRYKHRSIDVKFKQQLFLGMGGATVFGLAGALGSALLAGLSGGALLPWVGLGALAVVGVGFIYLGSKYLSESIMLDQDFQAKKIGVAARGAAPAIEQEKGNSATPPGMGNSVDADEAPTPKKAWAAEFAQHTAPASFAERLENAPDLQAARA